MVVIPRSDGVSNLSLKLIAGAQFWMGRNFGCAKGEILSKIEQSFGDLVQYLFFVTVVAVQTFYVGVARCGAQV